MLVKKSKDIRRRKDGTMILSRDVYLGTIWEDLLNTVQNVEVDNVFIIFGGVKGEVNIREEVVLIS